MTLILSNEDVEALLSMSDCVSALEEGYRELAHERAASALRSNAVSTTARPDAVYSLKLMGGVIPSLGVGAVRLNSDIISFGTERQVKLPLAPGSRYTGLVLLFSSETGEPLAIFPDGVLQRMRVGAASALGAKYLARPDATTVGLIGAGWQAGAQVMAIAAMRRIEVIRCYSPTREKREAFCAEMTERTGVTVRPSRAPRMPCEARESCCAQRTRPVTFFSGSGSSPACTSAASAAPSSSLTPCAAPM